MAKKTKVYRAEEIPEAPFPQANEIVLGETAPSSGSGGEKRYNSVQIKDSDFPRRVIARETISSVLNTKSKKITGKLEFTQKGSLQIGIYTAGVSGDLRLSPMGIVGRNQSGAVTFSIDGDTGDATFRGIVQAGSVLSDTALQGGSININDKFTVDEEGNVEVTGGSININDKFTVDEEGNVEVTDGNITVKDEDESTVIDSKGLVSTASFTSDTVTVTADQFITSTSYVDVTNATLTTENFDRARTVLVLYSVQLSVDSSDGVSSTSTSCSLVPNIDGHNDTTMYVAKAGARDEVSGDEIQNLYSTHTMHLIKSLGTGAHTIKIVAKVNNSFGTGKLSIFKSTLSYLILGN